MCQITFRSQLCQNNGYTNTFSKPKYRGCRAGTRKIRQIKTVVTKFDDFREAKYCAMGVNRSNLIDIQLEQRQCTNERWINFSLINPRSVRNKHMQINDFVVDNKLDFLAITETWLSEETESDIVHSLTPEGFSFSHKSGGGTGLIFNSYIKYKDIPTQSYMSFEVQEHVLFFYHISLRLCIIYRPPRCKNASLGDFFKEIEEYFTVCSSCTESLLIVGDFNIHFDSPDSHDVKRFYSLLGALVLQQKVDFPTHSSGHCLDLMIVKEDDMMFSKPVGKEPALSDHLAICSKFLSKKPDPSK